jgi:cbb3-type cytochrome oxidase maturation protein
MTIIYLLIGCSISIALLFLIGFLWSIKSGQYDDTYTPAVRMLLDTAESKAAGNQEPSKMSEPSQQDA